MNVKCNYPSDIVREIVIMSDGCDQLSEILPDWYLAFLFRKVFISSLIRLSFLEELHISGQCSLTMTPWNIIRRSNHRRCSVRKGLLRNFAKFAGKHLCQSLVFNKVADLRQKFWRTLFLQNTSRRLLLYKTRGFMFSAYIERRTWTEIF